MTSYPFNEYKYTERMVRQDDRLVKAALQYLERYTGDYEFLLMARKIHSDGDKLSVGTIKGILNCMRGDPEGYPLLPKNEPKPPEDSRPARKLKLVKTPPRRRVIDDLKQKFHGDYLLSLHKSAQVAHYLDHSKTKLIYVTNTHHGYDDYASHMRPLGWQFRPVALCGKRNQDTHRITETNWGRRMCPQCVAVKQEMDQRANALIVQKPIEPTVELCNHCGRAIDLGYTGRATLFGLAVCHPNRDSELDCYRLITVHGEGIGTRRHRN